MAGKGRAKKGKQRGKNLPLGSHSQSVPCACNSVAAGGSAEVKKKEEMDWASVISSAGRIGALLFVL